jgi:hypothetical protein
MKTKIAFLLLWPIAAMAQLSSPIPYSSVDIATLTTNATYSIGYATATNFFTNTGFLFSKTNTVNVGDSFPIAFGKFNTFMWQVDEWATTNNFGGGGAASNAIASQNGFGTNTSFYSTTMLDNSNLSISLGLDAASNTNFLYAQFTGLTYGMNGIYKFIAASNAWFYNLTPYWSDLAVTNNNGTGEIIEWGPAAVWATGPVPGTSGTWSGAGPNSGASGSVYYTNYGDILQSKNGIDIWTTTGLFVNGQPYITNGAGTVYTNNTTGNAGVVSGSGIGTNIPVQPYALSALSATNAPDGNVISSLIEATNVAEFFAAQASGGSISNFNGFGTNTTIYAHTTNIGSFFRTNGNLVIGYYTNVVSAGVWSPNTNQFTLSGAGDAEVNGVYVWQSSAGEYTTTNSGGMVLGAVTIDQNNSGLWQLGSFSYGGESYVTPLVTFPYSWQASNAPAPAPIGQWSSYNYNPNSYLTNVFVTVSPLGQVDTGGGTVALEVFGRLDAHSYYLSGANFENVLQGMQYPFLTVSNCAGPAVAFQGVFKNTWSGYYTNIVNGVELIPAGYYGSSVTGTNFSTSVSLICSNPAAIIGNQSFYSLTNGVVGYYSLAYQGPDAMPTNQPLVTAWWQTPFAFTGTVPIQTNSVGPHGIDLLFTNGLYMENSVY